MKRKSGQPRSVSLSKYVTVSKAYYEMIIYLFIYLFKHLIFTRPNLLAQQNGFYTDFYNKSDIPQIV